MAYLDFSTIVDRKSGGFVGRKWVFDRINTWLKGPSRIFLLVGSPGTGKSAIAARLTQLSDATLSDAQFPELRPGFLAYYHFCQAGQESTLSPLTFVRSLSETLANRYESFGRALANSGSTQIVVNVRQDVGSVFPGGQVTGSEFTIEIKGADPRPLFDLAVRIPARVLPKENQVVVLIDSLDEALTFHSEDTITSLLRLVNDFPPQFRFICTSRTNIDRVTDAVGQPALDLVADAPAGTDDVKVFALARLATLPEPSRTALADNLTVKSKGNFLYAHYVLISLLERAKGTEHLENLELPDELEEVYHLDMMAKIGTNSERWKKELRPLLGAIAVARGDGLTRPQLANITRLNDDDANDAIDECAQYLVGGSSEASPIRLYHQSFRDFLLQEKTNWAVFPGDRHAAIAGYMQSSCGSNWKECGDDYALLYTPAHWADAAVMSPAKREMRTMTLIELMGNEKYQRRFESHTRDLPMLHTHFERAVQVAALSGGDEMLLWLVRASKRLLAFRREYLRAEAIATLAETGLLDQAEARLQLFVDVDEDWLTAARLIIAWLGIDKSPEEAKKLRDRTAQSLTSTKPLPLLLDRLSASLDGVTSFAFEEGFAESLDYGRQIVNRISGLDFDRELLSSRSPNISTLTTLGHQSELLDHRGYEAYLDGPVLVTLAHAHGEEGTALLDEYISAHTGYNYLQYRNRSLWIVLQAVLRHHPDQSWVKHRLKQLMIVSLSGGGVDFEEMLPMTVEALRQTARVVQPSRASLENWRHLAQAAAQGLAADRNKNDLWGSHKRRLTALMELHLLLLNDQESATALKQDIQALPSGFAGFQAPASLRLADAFVACRMTATNEIGSTLESALRSAHHIQDYHLCARLTARCNAMKRWHARDLQGEDLVRMVKKLAATPRDIEFATDHFVGELYQHRDLGPDVLSIDPARSADTLESLAEVFQRPTVEFRRCNPDSGLDQHLAASTPIRVPDQGFPPLLAVHLAARVLADESLDDRRSALIRDLVPVAAANPTTLDTVLSYLLIAADPGQAEILGQMVNEVGAVRFGDVQIPDGRKSVPFVAAVAHMNACMAPPPRN